MHKEEKEAMMLMFHHMEETNKEVEITKIN
jgi:ferritin